MALSADSGRAYIAIDLKSYYASVECMQRQLDPLKTNLVVADPSRTEKTICLAVSPSLKAHGISGRARLFEVVQRVKEVNELRMRNAVKLGLLPKNEDNKYYFPASSFLDDELKADPSLELSYIVAPPQMGLYEKISTQIFSIYTKYVSPEDIVVYSIDECFIDATHYLKTYHVTAQELAIMMIQDVLHTTSITATAGIGTNLYLAKVAMDVVAKHAKPDKDGVRMAELNEQTYRELLWCHRPITDFWRVGKGIANRMEELGLFTMGDIARQSVVNETPIYDALGINAELLIDHAWGWEPTDIRTIKEYKPETNSLSSGQVLMEPYDFEKGKLIVREMSELLALDLVRKKVVTKKVTLTVGYDRESLQCKYQGKSLKDSKYVIAKNVEPYNGSVVKDYYGRVVPKPAHGTFNLDIWTASSRKIIEGMLSIYDRTVDKELLVRRINVAACDLISENEIPEEAPEQLSLFTDYEAQEKEKAADKEALEREKKIQRATLAIQGKYGKNALLKGMNLSEGATTKMRNEQIGGHKK